MKRGIILGGFILCFFIFGMLTGCDDKKSEPPPPSHGPYDNFYNYPTGRVDSVNGRLTVTNSIAGDVLLFDGTVEASKYLGTIGSLGSVRLRLPEQKFYSIVAVQKTNYEERRDQASQFSEFTYYSNTQTYSITVSPSSLWGGGNWVFENFTPYWVEVKTSDLSQNYAVIQPRAPRTVIPLEIGVPHQFTLYFSRELKFNGVIVARVEVNDPQQDKIAIATTQNPTFTTEIDTVNASTDIKPSVLVRNRSDHSVRVFYGPTQKTNGAPVGDFVVGGGQNEIVSGFEAGDVTSSIAFRAPGWSAPGGGGDRNVPSTQNITMQNDKIYEIIIPQNGNAADITVEEVDASTYFD